MNDASVRPRSAPEPTIARLLDGLARRDVLLSERDGAIVHTGSPKALTLAERDALRRRSAEVLAYLRAKAAVAGRAFKPAPNAPPVPAPIQAMWWGWVHGAEPQLPHERLCIVVPLDGVDAGLAEACMRELVKRHATLRSRFKIVDGELAIALNPADGFVVETVSLAKDGPLSAALEAERLRLLKLPIRIQDPWLARGRIVERDGAVVAVALVAHHMVLDARSLVLLEKELRALIETRGDASALPPAPQYVDYGPWERDWLDREGGPLLAWWRDWLQGAPAPTTPAGRSLVWAPGTKAYWDATFAGSGVERLRRLTAAANCTGFTAVLAATALAATRWSRQSRFPVRVIGDLRTSRALAGMVGNLVCTDLVDMRVDENASVMEWLRGAAVEYTAASRLRLPNLLGLPDSPAFPDVRPGSIGAKTALTLNYLPIYAFRGAERPAPDQTPVASRMDQSEHWPTPMCPINLRVWDYGPRLHAKMEFNGDLITADEQRRFAELFAASLVELSEAAAS